MATVIKLKRGTSTPTTSDLANGEVGIDTSAKKFYINDSGTIKEIGGGTGGGGGAAALGGDVRAYTGDGSTTGYTVTSGADVENVLVFINGVYQRPTSDYTVSGTTLTFGTAPVNADVITIKELVEGGTSLIFSDDSSTTTELSSGSTLKVAGGSGVTTSISGDTLTIAASGASDVFKNIVMPDGSTTVSADSNTDTLTLAQSGLISITGDSSTDTVTVSTVSSSTIPFLKSDGSSSNIELQTSGSISDVISNLHIPFTLSDGTDVTTLVVA